MNGFHKGHCALGVLHVTLAGTCMCFWLSWPFNGCFCWWKRSDWLSTGWSGGIDLLDSPFTAPAAGRGGFGSVIFKIQRSHLDLEYSGNRPQLASYVPGVLQAGMQLNRPKSAHLISSSPHNSSSYSSQFKSMRFSYHISSGLPSPQPALRRTGESEGLYCINGCFDICGCSVSLWCDFWILVVLLPEHHNK